MSARLAYYYLFLLILFSCFYQTVSSQNFVIKNNRQHASVPFKFVRNLIVVQLKINGTGPYNFVMDTGVEFMVITDPSLVDITAFLPGRELKLAGVGGEQYMTALITMPLQIDLATLACAYLPAAILKQDDMGISQYAGIKIHGLLGYDFFKDLVVKINFTDSTITAYNPDHFKPKKKYVKIPLVIDGKKPYINTKINFLDNSEKQSKLLVDLGAGHSLSLGIDEKNNWSQGEPVSGSLGMGLTGLVSGSIARINSLAIDKFTFKNVLVCFPDSLNKQLVPADRDGSLGVDMLKRFELIFDYKQGFLYLKSRGMQKEPFEHDMSGMEYYADNYDGVSHIVISRVESGSAADNVSIQSGDEIISVNSAKAADLGLEGLDNIFRSGNGRNLTLRIGRNNRSEKVVIVLKRRI